MTIREHLNTIADPEIKARALRCANPHSLDYQEGSLSGAIDCMVTWTSTKEQHDFWSSISHTFRRKGNYNGIFNELVENMPERERIRITLASEVVSQYQIY